MYPALYCLRMANRSRKWPTTDGRVRRCHLQRVRGSYRAVVNNDYSVKEHNYTGNRLAFGYRGGLKTSHQAIVDRLEASPSVMVRYDPANPDDSVLTCGINRNILFVMLLSMMFFCLGLYRLLAVENWSAGFDWFRGLFLGCSFLAMLAMSGLVFWKDHFLPGTLRLKPLEEIAGSTADPNAQRSSPSGAPWFVILGRILTVTFLLASTVAGSVLLQRGWNAVQVAKTSVCWPEVSAVILKSETKVRPDSSPEVLFRYVVDGRRYIGSHFYPEDGFSDRDQQLASLYAVGSSHLVHYDPQCPIRAYLTTSLRGYNISAALCGLFFCLGPFPVAMVVWLGRNGHQ